MGRIFAGFGKNYGGWVVTDHNYYVLTNRLLVDVPREVGGRQGHLLIGISMEQSTTAKS